MTNPAFNITAAGGDCPARPSCTRKCEMDLRRIRTSDPHRGRDIQQMPADFAVTELWQVLTGQALGGDPGDVTVGTRSASPLEDYSALRYMPTWPGNWGRGRHLPDPRNCRTRRIFGFIPALKPSPGPRRKGRRRLAGRRRQPSGSWLAHAAERDVRSHRPPRGTRPPCAPSASSVPHRHQRQQFGASMGPEALRVAGIVQAVSRFWLRRPRLRRRRRPANP